MKNIITVLLILIVPVFAYLFITKNLQNDSVEAKETGKPSLMVFTSTMCMDCQKMKALIKEVEPDYADKVNFIAVNALANDRKVKETIKKYNVVLVPTLIFLDENNNQIKKIEGYIPKEKFEAEIEELING